MVITIMKLLNLISFYYITNQFNMGQSMTREVIWKVYLVIQNILAICFICLVNPQEVVISFHHMSFPIVWGSWMAPNSHSSACPKVPGHQQIQGLLLHHPEGHVDHQVCFTHIFESRPLKADSWSPHFCYWHPCHLSHHHRGPSLPHMP